MNELAIQGTPVGFGYLSAEAYLDRAWTESARPIAAIIHGGLALPRRPWPQINSNLCPLTAASQVEVLHTANRATYGREDGFEIATAGEILFAAGRIEESPTATLSALSEQLYARLIRLIRRRGYPHLLRTWNILPDINRNQDGLERYRRFSLGRYAALAQHGADLEDRYPAASAVGSRGGGLCVYVLAAKTPGSPVENPKQVSAYRYPARYGPRSPSFSRSLVKRWEHGASLFVSGTASITGHESRHAGQLTAQARETLDNIASLVGAAERASGSSFPLGPGNAVLKAYIRDSADCPDARQSIENRLGAEVPVAYLQADICREELLFEIEGAIFNCAVDPPRATSRAFEKNGRSGRI